MIFRNFLINLTLTTFIFISCISKNYSCDNSSITLVGKALNADGSTSYVLDLFVELGTFDNSYYGFTLTFNSSSGTPQVILGGPQPTTATITSANLGAGSLSGSLTALTNSNINSIANDNCWTKYENQTNVVSYESNQLFGATSNDFTTSVKIKVMGCVDEIIFDAHPRMSSGISCNSPLCLYTLNLNNTPFIQVSSDTTICNNNSVELYADTAFGGILTEQFTMSFDAPFTHTTTNTTLPGTYYAIISGTFFGSTNETRDACYGNGWFNGFVWSPGIVWKWNGLNPSTQAQIPNYFNSNHEYQLFFSGGAPQTFSFTDNGSYLDNGGSLDFKIYYLGNFTWNNGITTTTNLVSPTSTTTFTATVDQGGCINSDDVIVTVSPTNNTIDTQIACGSFTWSDGNTYTSSNNTASQLLTNNNGCDSTVTLNLTINPTSSSTDNQTACDTFTWQDGITYTANNNTATHILTNALGCDSIVTLNLTITNSTTGVDTQTSCDSFTWIDGITYTSNNSTATHVLVNSVGCDSIVTLNLEIINSSSYIDSIVACDSINWLDGITYTTNNSSATYVTTNFSGCDSTIFLDLTINNSSSYTDSYTSCDSFTWSNGVTYTSSNSSASQILINNAGCDSIVTLNLIITNSNSIVDSLSACDSLTWIDGFTYSSNNNNATFNLINNAGCDSIVTLDLTINNSSYINLYDTICTNDLPFSWEGQTFTQQGNQTVNYNTTFNCDSILNLYLIVNDTPNVYTNINDTVICIDSNIVLFGIGASTYIWDNNLVIDSIPFIPIENSYYHVTGTDTNNCSSISSVYIELIQCYNIPFSIEIPNSFSPNFDGNNDEFLINGTSFEIISIKIFNRWGQILFNASNNLPWDGRLSSGEQSPEGTYYYTIEYKAFQPTGGFVKEEKTGIISLFR